VEKARKQAGMKGTQQPGPKVVPKVRDAAGFNIKKQKLIQHN